MNAIRVLSWVCWLMYLLAAVTPTVIWQSGNTGLTAFAVLVVCWVLVTPVSGLIGATLGAVYSVWRLRQPDATVVMRRTYIAAWCVLGVVATGLTALALGVLYDNVQVITALIGFLAVPALGAAVGFGAATVAGRRSTAS